MAQSKEEIRERKRKYYEANKEKLLERQRAYREANKEKIKVQERAYRESNKTKRREYDHKHHEANKEKKRNYREANKEEARKYREANKDKRRESERRRIYNMTPEQHESMLQAQGGGCAICSGVNKLDKKTARRKPLNVDHCHETGEIRGLLCTRCNTALGSFGDNIAGLKRALAYLEDFEQRVRERQALLESFAEKVAS